MKLKQDEMTRGLDKFLPSTKKWLLAKGYITRNVELADIEYQWTKEGLQWINGLKLKKNTP